MRIENILRVIGSAAVGIMMLSVKPAMAGLYNPSFDQGLDGWVSLPSSGSVSTQAGAAHLTTGEGVNPFSAVLIQGDAGDFSFSNPVAISLQATHFEFDLGFLSKVVDPTEIGGGYSDYLSLNIYDKDDQAFDMHFTSLDLIHNMLDISSLAGRNVAFSFELSDEDDGFNLSLTLDNLNIFERTSVPESNSLVLFLMAIAFSVFARRRAISNH